MSDDAKKPTDAETTELSDSELEPVAGGFAVADDRLENDGIVAKSTPKRFFRPSPTGDGTTEH